MSCPLEPIRFAVDGLLSQELHLLAGAPKPGKSWLALCGQPLSESSRYSGREPSRHIRTECEDAAWF